MRNYTQAQAYLHERGIPDALAHEAGIHPVDAGAIRRGMWGAEEGNSIPGDGLVIPYRTLAGAEMLGLDGLPFRRYRIFDMRAPKELPEGAMGVRYMSAPSSGYRPYIPAGLDRLLPDARILLITEGEIKALAAVAHGIACVGIGGVTLWPHPESVVTGDEYTPSTPIHPEIVELATRVGRVVVIADSDAKKNASVRQHMQLLTSALKIQCPGVVVAYMRVPDSEKRGTKQGLDDWLQAKGTKDVEGLIRWHITNAEKDIAAIQSGGYKALGYDDAGYYAWSVAKGAMEFIGKKDLTNSALLIGLCRLDWCEAAHGRVAENGNVSVEWMQLGGALAAACEAAGPFNPDKIRGPGVWAHENDPDALVINSAEVWRADGAPIDRVTEQFVYPRYRDLGLKIDTPSATNAEVSSVLSALQTWSWGRPSDASLMLGWIGLGYVTGALPWRPHMSLTGVRGAGKSTLMTLVRNLLGGAAVYSEGGSTEAGIRQAVKSSAPALLLDEGEADGPHLAKILEYLRVASSGGSILKGTSDQKGVRFTLRALGMIAGINPPEMQPADASRFLRLTLEKPSMSAARAPHPLLDAYSGEAAETGLRMWARMLRSWPRYRAARKVLCKHMRADEARSLDTLSPAIASAWVLLHDGELTDEAARDFLSSIDLADDYERISSASDQDDLWALLVTRAVQTSASGASQRTTVGEMLEQAAAERTRGSWSRELRTYGMKLVAQGGRKFELRVDPKSTELKALFRGTKFELSDMAIALRRCPRAHPKMDKSDRIGFGSDPIRYVAITLDIDPPVRPLDPDSLA